MVLERVVSNLPVPVDGDVVAQATEGRVNHDHGDVLGGEEALADVSAEEAQDTRVPHCTCGVEGAFEDLPDVDGVIPARDDEGMVSGALRQAVVIQGARKEYGEEIPRSKIHKEVDQYDGSPRSLGIDAGKNQLGTCEGHGDLQALHHVPHERINKAGTKMKPRHHAMARCDLFDKIELVPWPHKLHGRVAKERHSLQRRLAHVGAQAAEGTRGQALGHMIFVAQETPVSKDGLMRDLHASLVHNHARKHIA
mmetsp:Transcript_126177/g.269165  ORF Transcript_126177/g.269165 Transcript_126177/m.269165 type:complete len:252 (-) Transcript_126177:1981-2736(-)